MRTIFDHIENVKGKPHHVRKRVAMSGAMIGTAVIAFVWLGTSLSTGAFAIQGSTFADSVAQGSPVVVDSDTRNQNIAGAAAALKADASGPARVEIVTVATSTGVVKKSERTTIPF